MKIPELLKHIERLTLKQSCNVWKDYTWCCEEITTIADEMLIDSVPYVKATGRIANNGNLADYLRPTATIRISREVFQYIDKLTENDVKLVWIPSERLYLSLEMARCGEVILEKI